MKARFLLALALATSWFANAADNPSKLEPSHAEKESIGSTEETKFGTLTSFCLDPDGNLLCCDSDRRQVKVITQLGKVVATWPLPFAPHRAQCAPNGEVYVGGDETLARFDSQGNLLKRIEFDGQTLPKTRVSGIGVTKSHVFVSLGTGWSLSSKANIFRLTRDLAEPAEIARNLRGCCQRLDLAANGDGLFVAENARFRVVQMNAEGETVTSWGEQARDDVEGFGSCCNPMNIAFGPQGALYTAESGMGRIKRYSAKGEFLGLIGEVGVQRFTRAGRTAASCSNITIAVAKDGSRVFVQDVNLNLIRVLLAKNVTPSGAPPAQAATLDDTTSGNRPYRPQ